MKAATNRHLGDLKALVSDLQTANAPVQLPHLNKPRVPGLAGGGGAGGMRAAVAAVLSVLWGGYRLGLYGNTRHRSTSRRSRRQGRRCGAGGAHPPRQLQSLGGLNGLLEQMKKKFGDTMGYRLVIYPDYASLDRPDPGDDRRTLNYSYRGGWDDPTTSPKSPDATPVDLSKFDAKAVVGVLRGAPETLNIKPGDVKNTYLIVEPSRDPTAPAPSRWRSTFRATSAADTSRSMVTVR